MLNRRELLMGAAVIAPTALFLQSGAGVAKSPAQAGAAAKAAAESFPDFPKAFKGPLVRQDDPSYASVKKIWNSRPNSQQPALIARAATPDDVLTAVRYAVRKNIPVAVHGGGHGIEGFSMPQDALVIDMSLLKAIKVDSANGHVTVQAGVKLGELVREADKYGLAVPAGTVSDVGVAGLTLGGGIGHLIRRFGATVDNLLSVDVVTMDGRKLTASKTQNPDLFWGMRGAGQNLAIATSFTFQGHKLESVITRTLFFAPKDALAVLVGLNDVMARSPRELTITPIVQRAGPMPGLPADMVGKPIVIASVVYTGAADKFDAAMTEARKLPAPIMQFEGPSTWTGLSTVLDDFMPGGRRWYNGGGYLAALTKDVAQIALDGVAVAPVGAELHIPVMGGALLDFPEDSAAFSRANAHWMYEITAQWDDPAADKDYMAWVETLGAKLRPHTLPNGSINLNPYRGPDSVAAIYGSAAKWQRIVALKQKWDPHNRLRYNKNIVPVAAKK